MIKVVKPVVAVFSWTQHNYMDACGGAAPPHLAIPESANIVFLLALRE